MDSEVKSKTPMDGPFIQFIQSLDGALGDIYNYMSNHPDTCTKTFLHKSKQDETKESFTYQSIMGLDALKSAMDKDKIRAKKGKKKIINEVKLFDKVFKVLSDCGEIIKTRDDKLFSRDFIMAPGVNLKHLWNYFDDTMKDRVWTYLNILLTSGSLHNISLEDDFDPFIGVKAGDGKLSEMAKVDLVPEGVLTDKKADGGMSIPGLGGIDLSSIAKQIGEADKDELKKASDELKSTLGESGAGGFIADMISSVTEELGKSDLSKGNPLQNLMQLANRVTESLAPKLDGQNPEELFGSTMELHQKMQKGLGVSTDPDTSTAPPSSPGAPDPPGMEEMAKMMSGTGGLDIAKMATMMSGKDGPDMEKMMAMMGAGPVPSVADKPEKPKKHKHKRKKKGGKKKKE
jgi:hypothetical protein